MAGPQPERVGRLARSLEAEADPGAVLDEIVTAAVRFVPGVEDASVTLVVARRQVTSRHRTGDLPERVDAIQTGTGEGPCLDAAYEQDTVRVPDLRSEQRWPHFAQQAVEAGAGSMLSFQLYVHGDTLGVLNLYSRHPDAFDDESEQVGLLLADQAAAALARAQELDHLQRAAASRDLIGQARGMLMERYGIDDGAAFRVLAEVGRSTDRTLRAVAEELVTTRRIELLQDP